MSYSRNGLVKKLKWIKCFGVWAASFNIILYCCHTQFKGNISKLTIWLLLINKIYLILHLYLNWLSWLLYLYKIVPGFPTPYICCGPSFVLNDLRWEVVVCLLIFEELLTITVWTSCLISRKESLSSQRQLPLFNLFKLYNVNMKFLHLYIYICHCFLCLDN